jgi:hypothetical protein
MKSGPTKINSVSTPVLPFVLNAGRTAFFQPGGAKVPWQARQCSTNARQGRSKAAIPSAVSSGGCVFCKCTQPQLKWGVNTNCRTAKRVFRGNLTSQSPAEPSSASTTVDSIIHRWQPMLTNCTSLFKQNGMSGIRQAGLARTMPACLPECSCKLQCRVIRHHIKHCF